MHCLRKYKWIKLHRACLPEGRGLMGHWARLTSRAAFRKGCGHYCGHRNPVTPGMWYGGIVGLKSILGVRRRSQALQIMDELQELGYIQYTLDLKTKKLSYKVMDWVARCTGTDSENGSVYATEGYGFIGVPRQLTDRLAAQNRIFSESDAWLDLWCHTTYRDRGNVFSFLSPAIQYGKYGTVLTLELLGRRWSWEKTKVWRFFRDHAVIFSLIRLPGSYGCVIFNNFYLDPEQAQFPKTEAVLNILQKIRSASRPGIQASSDSERLNFMVAWNSVSVIRQMEEQSGKSSQKRRIAPLCSIIRAYFSHGRNCKYGKNSINDCRVTNIGDGIVVRVRYYGRRVVRNRGSPALSNNPFF